MTEVSSRVTAGRQQISKRQGKVSCKFSCQYTQYSRLPAGGTAQQMRCACAVSWERGPQTAELSGRTYVGRREGGAGGGRGRSMQL